MTGGKPGSYFNGNRYIKDSDPGAMVLMDKNGYIAGIQAGVSVELTSHGKLDQRALKWTSKVTNPYQETQMISEYRVREFAHCSAKFCVFLIWFAS